MMLDSGGRHSSLQATLVLALLLVANLHEVDLIEPEQNSQHRRQNASQPAQNGLVAASTNFSSRPPIQQQTQQARMQPPLQPHLPRPQTAPGAASQSMQLSGKCASKGSCSRELASRRLDLDSGPDKQACYCDQLCATYDDCCRDSRWAEPLASRLAMGLEELHKRRAEWQCMRVNPIYTTDVLLKASCHPDWLAKQTNKTAALVTRQRCEMLEPNAPHMSDPMGSLMPITDVTSGITYANSHCLRCNPPQQVRSSEDRQQKQKLIYWSPRVTCNYNLDSDDRNTLYDLISSKKGQALRYSRRRNKWLVRVRAAQSASNTTGPSASIATANITTTSHSDLTEDLADADAEAQSQRICSIHPTIPDSMEHFVRHCRSRMIDWCPPPTLLNITHPELVQARQECHFGYQSLVYSQTSDLVYFNLACARCHQERQVFCEPRLKKQLDNGNGPVSRITSIPSGQRASSAPTDPFEAGTGGGAGYENQLDDIPKSRNNGEGSFSVLMDLYGGLQGDDSNEQVGAVHRCEDAERQVYDPFLLTCRDIVCGLNHRFVDGACVQVADDESPSNLVNLNLNLNFTAETPAANSASLQDKPLEVNSSSALVGGSSQVQVAGASKPDKTEEVSAGAVHEEHRGRESSAQSASEDKLASSSGPPSKQASTDKSRRTANTSRPPRLDAGQQRNESSEAAATTPAGARLVAGGSSNNQSNLGHDQSSGRQDAPSMGGRPNSDNDNNSFVELLARLQQDDLPQPTSESRRAFAECGKILVQPEHYRLFTVADLESSSVTPRIETSESESSARLPPSSSSSSSSSPPTPTPDAKFLSASEHHQRADKSPSSWEQRQNIWALVAPYNLTLASSQFELVRGISAGEQQSGQVLKLLVCSPFKSDLVAKFKPTMVYLTTCCLAVSIASLVCFLVLYGLSTFDLRHLVVELTQAGQMDESLRTDALDSKFRGSRASNDTSYNATRSQNLSSRGVACLATALLAAYLLFILGHQQQQEQPTTSSPGVSPPSLTGCTIIAAATFCSFLMAFNWMFLLSYDIWRTLRLATCQLRAPTMSSQSRRFIVYALCATGLAVGITALALAVDQFEPAANCAAAHVDQNQSLPAATCPAQQQTEFERLMQIYRPKFGKRAGSCWFSNRRSLALFFGLPVTLIMFVNLLFFLHSSFMVIKTSSRSSRRPVTAASSNCSNNSQVSSIVTTQTSHAQANDQQHYLSELDFAQQNGMTTSSLSSVQTIQSNLSLRSESEFEVGSGDESLTTSTTTGGATRAHETIAAECQQAAAQIQIQIDQIDSTSRRLGEEARLCASAAAATRRHSFRCAKQESSSSLLSGASSRSLAGNSSSLASNLAQKYDAHLNNLSAFMSSIVKDYRLYCRLSTIMGLTWLTGLMASVVDQSDLLWYLFVVLNTLQGLFIFVAFGFKRSRLTNVEILFNYLRFRLAAARGRRRRTSSETGGLDEKASPTCERPTHKSKGGDF